MQNHEYYQYIMHAVKIYAENYANAKKSQVDTTWRSHPPTANSTYQQLSAVARLFAARTPPVFRPRPSAFHLHPSRTYQFTHNR